MNKRIEELALKSGLINYVDNETPRRYFIDGNADLEELEKFAELIVRECMGIADEFEVYVNQGGLVDRFKEHFGVE